MKPTLGKHITQVWDTSAEYRTSRLQTKWDFSDKTPNLWDMNVDNLI